MKKATRTSVQLGIRPVSYEVYEGRVISTTTFKGRPVCREIFPRDGAYTLSIDSKQRRYVLVEGQLVLSIDHHRSTKKLKRRQEWEKNKSFLDAEKAKKIAERMKKMISEGLVPVRLRKDQESDMYCMDKDGIIWTANTVEPRRVKSFRTFLDYMSTSLKTREKRVTFLTARLVAFTLKFDTWFEGADVQYIDFDKKNTHPSNLRWVPKGTGIRDWHRMKKGQVIVH